MASTMTIQGRELSSEDIGLIQRLLAEHLDWGRTRLSEELCHLWDWRNANCRIKDMAARTLLLKLERGGFIQLPERRRPSSNGFRNSHVQLVEHATAPICGALRELMPVVVSVVESGSAAWKCAARDTWVGWDRGAREANLGLMTNNTRFLVLPWVTVPHLASHILAHLARRIGADWQHKYGHPIHALETFVDRERFKGTCYRAANWVRLGQTQGRTRNDREHSISASVKDVYLYPLTKGFRQKLCSC